MRSRLGRGVVVAVVLMSTLPFLGGCSAKRLAEDSYPYEPYVLLRSFKTPTGSIPQPLNGGRVCYAASAVYPGQHLSVWTLVDGDVTREKAAVWSNTAIRIQKTSGLAYCSGGWKSDISVLDHNLKTIQQFDAAALSAIHASQIVVVPSTGRRHAVIVVSDSAERVVGIMRVYGQTATFQQLAPLAGSDGDVGIDDSASLVVAMGCRGAALQAWDGAGKQLWKVEDRWSNSGNGLVSVSGLGNRVVAGRSGAQLLSCFDAKGAVLWEYATNRLKSLSISTDGNTVAFLDNRGVTVLDGSGVEIWHLPSKQVAPSGFGLSGDATTIAVSHDSSVDVYTTPSVALQSVVSLASVALKHCTDAGIPCPEAQVLLDGLHSPEAAKSYSISRSEAEQAVSLAKSTLEAGQAAVAALKKAREAISALSSAKYVPGKAASTLDEAERAFEATNYEQSKSLAQESSTEAGKIAEAAAQADGMMMYAGKGLQEARAAKWQLGSLTVDFESATNTFKSGDYSSALDQLADVSARVQSTLTAAPLVQEKRALALARVRAETRPGVDIARAQALVDSADAAIETGDYATAVSDLDKAIAVAPDVDRDGVPNRDDFSPNINNYVIFGTPIVAAAGLLWLVARMRRRRQVERENKALLDAVGRTVAEWETDGYDLGDFRRKWIS
ncbi:hypothetical protein SMC3_08340 [Candidatus Cryosericum hinesii]|uniref:Uncharacterized protein n=1 Tax=Candidatus Cryosericum hinesii TaxID=2290915 RepID=A0A398DHV0_9BACT|nr:hypothetical protein [Candidatus Cryosericum hinesii]RIE11787.1 hypothetical protein SMC3_08340 [Candidatus Cryosericum hinesii]